MAEEFELDDLLGLFQPKPFLSMILWLHNTCSNWKIVSSFNTKLFSFSQALITAAFDAATMGEVAKELVLLPPQPLHPRSTVALDTWAG